MKSTESYGPVTALHLGRRILGVLPPLMTVRCFVVDGLLVDSGLSPFARVVTEFAEEHRVEQVVISHHHEDHSGNASALVEKGIRVRASSDTAERLAGGFGLYPYQKLLWGRSPAVTVEEVESVVKTDRYEFRVIPAPGHSEDQIVLYEPSQGWLFSGDAFLADRIKYFRGDEDFGATIDTLETLSKLEFDNLYCAHRPVIGEGQAALKRKLDYLLGLRDRVQQLADQGCSIREITRRILGTEDRPVFWFTFGDMGKQNLIRSILEGPRPRKR